MHCSHAFHRGIQVVKSTVGEHRSNFRGHTVAAIAFIEHDYPRRFFRRIDQRFFIQRPRRAWIDNFRTDPYFFQQLGRTQRNLHHAARPDQRDVVSFALHIGHAKGNCIFLRWNRPFKLIHHLVFEKDHWIVIANCGLQQAFGVVGRRRQERLSILERD